MFKFADDFGDESCQYFQPETKTAFTFKTLQRNKVLFLQTINDFGASRTDCIQTVVAILDF
jgi:P pilus assembly chaperone PapD